MFRVVTTFCMGAEATAAPDSDPQALIALPPANGNDLALGLAGREYFVSRVASGTEGGHDNILRG